MKRSLFISFLFFCFQYSHAQKDTVAPKLVFTDSLSGKVEIAADSRIDSLMQVYKKINGEKQTVSGYRVQLFFGSERKKAMDIQSDFLQKYPELHAYLIYQQPNYKVRVGDFNTRLEAFNVYKKLSADYGSAFIVKDEIKLPEAK